MKNRSINILIVALLVLALLSIIFIFFIEDAHQTFERDITVEENGVTEAIIPVRSLRLNPTDTSEYKINLYCKAEGVYKVFLDYRESQDGGMRHFVNVTLKSGDDVIYSGSLSELLKEDFVVEYEAELFAKKANVITVIYEMPEAVGNEAQGTSEKFNVNLKIVKK